MIAMPIENRLLEMGCEPARPASAEPAYSLLQAVALVEIVAAEAGELLQPCQVVEHHPGRTERHQALLPKLPQDPVEMDGRQPEGIG